MLKRAVGHLLGGCTVTDAVEGIGETAGQPGVLGRLTRAAGDRQGEEFGRDPRRLAHQQVSGAGQPVQHPLVHRRGVRRVRRVAPSADHPQQLPGHPVGRRTRFSERASRVAVPGDPHRGRHLVV